MCNSAGERTAYTALCLTELTFPLYQRGARQIFKPSATSGLEAVYDIGSSTETGCASFQKDI